MRKRPDTEQLRLACRLDGDPLPDRHSSTCQFSILPRPSAERLLRRILPFSPVILGQNGTTKIDLTADRVNAFQRSLPLAAGVKTDVEDLLRVLQDLAKASPAGPDR